jgi:PRC-barrel domain
MYSTLRDYRFNKDIDDIRGSAVYGPGDAKLGKIDDVVFDPNSAQIKYLIVDTGGWLKSRRFLVPPDRVQPYPQNDKDFFVNLSKTEIERFPALDEKVLESDKGFATYETSYRSAWTSAPGATTTSTVITPRFTRFQDEIVRNRERICGPDVTRRKVS